MKHRQGGEGERNSGGATPSILVSITMRATDGATVPLVHSAFDDYQRRAAELLEKRIQEYTAQQRRDYDKAIEAAVLRRDTILRYDIHVRRIISDLFFSQLSATANVLTPAPLFLIKWHRGIP